MSAAGRCHTMSKNNSYNFNSQAFIQFSDFFFFFFFSVGNWEAALASAEIVLQKLPKDAKSVLIKAEALFNLCEFEHALLHFFRGQVN